VRVHVSSSFKIGFLTYNKKILIKFQKDALNYRTYGGGYDISEVDGEMFVEYNYELNTVFNITNPSDECRNALKVYLCVTNIPRCSCGETFKYGCPNLCEDVLLTCGINITCACENIHCSANEIDECASSSSAGGEDGSASGGGEGSSNSNVLNSFAVVVNPSVFVPCIVFALFSLFVNMYV
jgi:hypothetical protein